MKIPTKYLVLFLVVLMIGIIWSMLSQPGVSDLPGNFKEIALGQNENNTGPVRRHYIVTVADTLWTEMEAYGNYMPYAKLGTTTVWFFLDSKPYPSQLTEGNPPFAPIYQSACIGKYQKNNTGSVTLSRYPFR